MSSVVPRRRATVAGRITSVREVRRPWPLFDVQLSDGTGSITLRFMGRRAIPGMAPGCRLLVEGMPAREAGVLLMRNPLYSFSSEDNEVW